MKIAFIGLGNMGTGIAQCILKSGHDLIVWNRTATKTVRWLRWVPGRNDGPRSRRGRRCCHHEFDGRQVRA
jgi:3-hydroxyisobutyrate dehydrogenase and related beta-hydroxyacid dehydrogenases